MVPKRRYGMWLVWVVYNAAQLVCVCMSIGAAAEISMHHRPEPGISTLTQARRGVTNSGAELQGQQPEFPAESMQGLDGGTNWKKNFVCRSLARCLQAQKSAAPALSAEESAGVPAADETENPPMALPALPTDAEAHPAEPRTDPSTLVPPNSHPAGSSTAGGGGAATLSKGSTMASKVSITAGVAVSGLLLLLVALLYYFKPDIFLCCKTCVRVQVFHHPHPTKQ